MAVAHLRKDFQRSLTSLALVSSGHRCDHLLCWWPRPPGSCRRYGGLLEPRAERHHLPRGVRGVGRLLPRTVSRHVTAVMLGRHQQNRRAGPSELQSVNSFRTSSAGALERSAREILLEEQESKLLEFLGTTLNERRRRRSLKLRRLPKPRRWWRDLEPVLSEARGDCYLIFLVPRRRGYTAGKLHVGLGCFPCLACTGVMAVSM